MTIRHWWSVPLMVLPLVSTAEIPSRYDAPAAPHAVSYQKISVAPGDQVQINGYAFSAERIPVVDYTGGRYALTYLKPNYQESPPDSIGLGVAIGNFHTQENFSPDLLIDGFPAKLKIIEQQEYRLQRCYERECFEFSAFPNIYTFLTIDLGDAHLLLSYHFYGQGNQASWEADTPNALPGTRWWKLEENQRPVRVLDWIVDHIRIYRFP